MAIRKMTMRTWQKAVAATLGKPGWEKINGYSPGGVASVLRISRQAVHQAIRRGQMDALIVNDDETGELRLFMIPEASVEAYRAHRDQRKTG